MNLRIRGAELHLSFGLLPLLVFCIVTGETKPLLLAGASLLLHELAHWIAARNLGFLVERIAIYPFGAVMDLSAAHADTGGEWIVAAAGPLASFVIASALRLVGSLMKAGSAWIDPLLHTNLMIAVLNLLPAFPLDGGRIAKGLLLRLLNETTARRILLALTCVVSAGMIAGGIGLILRGIPALMLPATGAFLTAAALKECRRAGKSRVASVLERRMRLHDGTAQKATLLAIRDSATVGQAIADLSRTRYTVLRVIGDDRTFEMDEDALLSAASRCGYGVTLRAAFSGKEGK